MAHVLTFPLRAISFAAARPLGRRFLAVVSLALILAAGYWFWLRDSSLVAVQHVQVEGVSTSDAPQVRSALEQAASSMTTLHFDTDALREAVRPYPTVKSISADPSFPNGLTIHVTEQQPTAIARGGGRSIAIAADGTVLAGISVGGSDLPAIALGAAPAGRALSGDGLDEALVLGAAPAALRPSIDHTSASRGQVTVSLSGGIDLRFGASNRPAAKWAAAARLLADPRLATLSYIDLSVPERPAVGGSGALPPTDAATSTTTSTLTPAAPSGTIPQASATPAGAPTSGP